MANKSDHLDASNRQVCKQCPFRENSVHGSCEDGRVALASDYTPACHTITITMVGAGKQFKDPLPGDHNKCIGFGQWQADRKGFALPRLLRA